MKKALRLISFLGISMCLAGNSSAVIPMAFWRPQGALESSWTPQWSNLKAYWRMNGTTGAIASGGTLTDYFGTSNATATAAGNSYATGKLNNGVSFNGTTYFTVPRTAPANVCTSMTFMTWVKWNAPNTISWANLYTNWNNCATDASWNLNQSGSTKKVEVTFNTTAGFNQYADSVSSPLDGNWHHIAITLTSGGAAVIYIDGVQDVTWSISMGAGVCSPTAGIQIGGPACADTIGSGAMLDEMAIWNATLTAAEISKIYNRQKYGL